MRVSRKKSISDQVRVVQRKRYSCFCRIFCCKCMYCCQSIDFSLLTSQHRKDMFFKMIKKYVATIEKEEDVLIDPFFILVGLLMGEKNEQINKFTMMELGEDIGRHAIFSKEDLELYIPQLCTYLVFHQEMENIPIFNLLEHTSRTDLQFALIYYSYMKSLEVLRHNAQIKVVQKYNQTFLKKINHEFEFTTSRDPTTVEQMEIVSYQAGQNMSSFSKILTFPKLKFYQGSSQFEDDFEEGVFNGTLNFFKDLALLSVQLNTCNDKKVTFHNFLREMNKKLPAKVYLPFKNQNYHHMAILNIVVEECRIFSTKERTPLCLSIEIAKAKSQSRTHHKAKRVRSLTEDDCSNLKRSQLFQQDQSISNFNNGNDDEIEAEVEQELFPPNSFLEGVNKLVDKAKELYTQSSADINDLDQDNKQIDELNELFGESYASLIERLKIASPYSELPSYSVTHFMVKSNDDLRQESFAVQLLQEFNNIFKMEKLPIKIIPYEVMPLSHDYGVIEFLKDTITMDQLHRKNGNLNFVQKYPKKLQNFIHTLVGYSLVTYFLQVKDRHNGNILIRRDGCIIHIDFGFFMSNSPGKGVELQKNVAFKMTSEYIDAIGGLKSKHFQEFRKLFYQGYQACRKHQHRILILAKLMYSSHGNTMPCFQKGNEAIEALEDRFNPRAIRTDGDLSLLCQNLVNNTIDNWRGRWYDKWQYYMQGIFY